MPGGDRTGPMGAGPMTGRAAGFCAGFPAPGFMNPGFGGAWFGRRWFGRGRGGGGFGRGGGRGRRNWFYATGLTGWQRAAMGSPAWGWGVPAGMPVPPSAATPADEAELLRRQAEYLSSALDEIRRRLDELQAQSEKQE